MRKNLISVRNLKKYYALPKSGPFAKQQYIKAVDGIDLDIDQGETFGLVGESGCGKSTAGHMLVNLLKPTEGQIYYKDRMIAADQKKIRKNIQIVFQDPFSSLNPKKTIGWLLEEPLIIHHMYDNKEERKQAVVEMLNKVGLDTSFIERYPHQLSGGQRQRVSIAIALMLKPDFIVADEPVSALDVSVQAQILNLLKALQKEFGLTFLFISHDLNVVEYMSDKIGVMYMGKIVEMGSVKSIYENPRHPYTQALLSAIPAVDAPALRKRIILQGEPPNPADPPSGCPFYPRCHRALPQCSEIPPVLKRVNPDSMVCCHL